jgi:RsiW-degrading membrane proteinase PrsW (M82 family)
LSWWFLVWLFLVIYFFSIFSCTILFMYIPKDNQSITFR